MNISEKAQLQCDRMRSVRSWLRFAKSDLSSVRWGQEMYAQTGDPYYFDYSNRRDEARRDALRHARARMRLLLALDTNYPPPQHHKE